MLPSDIFTRPRGWQAKVCIRQFITNEDNLTPEQIQAKGKQIAAVLRSQRLFNDDETIEALENADELEMLNDALDAMYNECDRARIWVA